MTSLNTFNIGINKENGEGCCCYNEIAERKLKQLQKEYDDVIKADNTVPVDNDSDSNSDNDTNNGNIAYLPVNCIPNEDEFVEVIEENESDVNIKCNHNNNSCDDDNCKRKSVSPVKHKELVINAMKRIKLPPPKWAENLSDEEFMKGAKRLLEMKRNKHI